MDFCKRAEKLTPLAHVHVSCAYGKILFNFLKENLGQQQILLSVRVGPKSYLVLSLLCLC